MPIAQEKLQVTVPAVDEDGDHFVTFESARRVYITPSVLGPVQLVGRHGDAADSVVRLNIIPSTGIAEPCIEEYGMPLSAAGATDQSADTTVHAKLHGFNHLDMSPTEDQYTGEHTTEFFDDVTGENSAGDKFTGFVERNNMLDRL